VKSKTSPSTVAVHPALALAPDASLPLGFAKALVAWQKKHGRHDLPWQKTLDAYPVWLSEVMLQQTQVSTVKAYFNTFMARFPSVEDLALAPIDEVLSLWSGLGYYTRARNLHRCALEVTQKYGGVFPAELEALKSLPGIGESTAAAIASLCFQKRCAITDGNVRRVLARVLGFEGDMALGANVKWLSSVAQDLLPHQASSMPTYTQGIMDLGATVCKPKNPLCEACPVDRMCVAKEKGRAQLIPFKSKKVKRRAQQLFWLIAQNPQGEVLGRKRPEKGIWAGLYGFAEFDSEEALLEATASWLNPPPADSTNTKPKAKDKDKDKDKDKEPLAQTLKAPRPLGVVRHELTHLSLSIHPYHWRAPQGFVWPGHEWREPLAWAQVGLARPVEDLLRALS